MISKCEAESIIKKYFDVDRLKKIIRNTSVVAWKNQIHEKEIDMWLSNFTGKFFSEENEKKLALWLLSHFTYYSYSDIRILCKVLFNSIIHEKIREYKEDKTIEDVIEELIKDTLYVGLGNNSESGMNILYYFRQENKLPKNCFEKEKRPYKNVIFIDDVTISGSQVCEYIEDYKIEADHIYAGVLIATESAIKTIKKAKIPITIIPTMLLDNRDVVFSDDSYVFSEPKINSLCEIAKDFCKYYGSIAIEGYGYMDNYPLGYADGQYMLGFEYNTPDNTLPIFWGTSNGWIPLFERYHKLYSDGKESALDGRKYY